MAFRRTREELLRYRWTVYALAAGVYFLVYFHRVSPAALAQEFTREWVVTGSVLGIMSSLYFYMYAAVQIPSGMFTDTLGPKRLILFSASSMAAGCCVSYVATSFGMVAFGRALIGLGAGFTFVPLVKLLRYWFRRMEFARMVGLTVSIGNVGAFFAATPLIILMSRVGWRNSFLIVALITITLVFLNLRFVADRPEEMGFPPLEDADPEELDGESNGALQTIKRGFYIWFHNRTFLMLGVMIFLLYGTLMGFEGLWAGPFLAHVYGMSNAAIGGWLLIMAVGMMVGQVFGGWLADRFFIDSKQKQILIGAVVYTTSWGAFLWVAGSSHTILLGMLFFILSMNMGISNIPLVALVADLSPRQNYGTIMGIHNIFPMSGAAVFQVVMGKVLDMSNPTVVGGVRIFPLKGYVWNFTLCLFASFIIIIIAITLNNRLKHTA